MDISMDIHIHGNPANILVLFFYIVNVLKFLRNRKIIFNRPNIRLVIYSCSTFTQ